MSIKSASKISAPPRVLTLFSLVMINVIAVDSLRTLPFSAKFGSELVFYYLICTVAFLIPVGLVTAELATAWPKNGGIYVWTREAFGPKFGFLVVWLQWIYNVVWYPTVLGLIAGIIGYFMDPHAGAAPLFTLSVVLILFWLCTGLNCFGMRLSSWVSTFGSILGTLLPMLAIIVFCFHWILQGHPSQIHFDWKSMIPAIHDIHDLVLVSTILFGLMGLEMSAVHAQEVKSPTKNYPLALKISIVIIAGSLILSSLAVAIVVPAHDLSVITGLIQAFELFLNRLQLAWLLPAVGVVITIGAIGSVATWIIGPTKGLLVAAQEHNLPACLARTNKQGVPVTLLLIQALIVSALSMAYVLLPNVESAYLMLTQLTAILALLMYVLMFAAAFALRHQQPTVPRPFKIPGGNWGIGLVTLLGGGTSLAALSLCFLPPSQIDVGDPVIYQGLLVCGLAVFCLPAAWIQKRKA